jgi:hypothetical protein
VKFNAAFFYFAPFLPFPPPPHPSLHSVFGGLMAIFQWTLPKDEKKNSVYVQMQEGKHHH